MQIQINKILFVLLGIGIVIAGIFISKSHTMASVKEGQKFEDWTVNCFKDDKDKKNCHLVQSLSVNKDNKSVIVAAYQIGYYGEKKELKIIEVLPLGINVASGTSLISSGKLVVPGKFTICSSVGCNAVGIISEESLNQIFSSQENFVGYINQDGKQVNLLFSANGLKEGLKAIR